MVFMYVRMSILEYRAVSKWKKGLGEYIRERLGEYINEFIDDYLGIDNNDKYLKYCKNRWKNFQNNCIF